jgi:hypothetical protein
MPPTTTPIVRSGRCSCGPPDPPAGLHVARERKPGRCAGATDSAGCSTSTPTSCMNLFPHPTGRGTLTEEALMADIAIQIDTTADPAAAYAALITTDGVAGWLVDHAQPDQRRGRGGRPDVVPGRPMAWELRGDEAVPSKVLARHCVGGPRGGSAPTSASPSSRRRRAAPGSCSTIPASPRSTRCSASSLSDGAQMLLRLNQYLDSGQPAPFLSSNRPLDRRMVGAAVAVRGRAADGRAGPAGPPQQPDDDRAAPPARARRPPRARLAVPDGGRGCA